MDRFELLHACFDGKPIGEVRWNRDKDLLEFAYEESWRNNEKSFPLSLSMPMDAVSHGHKEVEAFLWGLLPDSSRVLASWGQRFGVSPRNPFRLLSRVGEDCAGAAQFIRPDRLEKVTRDSKGEIEWLSDSNLAERMTELLADHSLARYSSDSGQISLAGAQAKTALHRDPENSRWGVPSGRMPTTHIFKPATDSFDGHAENEHFCMCLAAECGMVVANSELMTFGDVTVFVTQRYDRILRNGIFRRIHQEDTCQSVARLPHMKYQNEGGPSAQEITDLLRESSSRPDDDIRRFTDALIFNWIIAGTDGHAKNYSVMLAGGGQVRLAPLYDLASTLPYPRQINPHKAKLAMKIGSKYKLKEIGKYSWEKQALNMRLKPENVRDRILSLIDSIPAHAQSTATRLLDEGIHHPVLASLRDSIAERCRFLKESMT